MSTRVIHTANVEAGSTIAVVGCGGVGLSAINGAAIAGAGRGSNMGSNRFRLDMPRFVEFYLEGKLKLDEMISRRIGLEVINAAFEEMKRGEVARSVVVFS